MNNIKKLRNQLGLMQVELAELLDVSIDSVRSWETGRRKPSKFIIMHLESKIKNNEINVKKTKKLSSRVLFDNFINLVEKELGFRLDFRKHRYLSRDSLSLDEYNYNSAVKIIELLDMYLNEKANKSLNLSGKYCQLNANKEAKQLYNKTIKDYIKSRVSDLADVSNYLS